MLTRLVVRNFKGLPDTDIELGRSVVFVGPNNSGKSTALQSLALWEAGMRAWLARRGSDSKAEKRSGVTLNRKELLAVPVPYANLLWRDLHVREGRRVQGKTQTGNILIQIRVEGVTDGREWVCGLEFDYANPESLYCRPLRDGSGGVPQRMPMPEPALLESLRVAFLPPMSGLATVEPKWEPGRINVLIGEGQTAQVLRNLCYRLHTDSPGLWNDLVEQIRDLFGVTLQPPEFVAARGEVSMGYRQPGRGPAKDVELDITAAGRGLQQAILLLAHLYANPRTILLLDEPDAHLEILRQRQMYGLLNEVAGRQGSQIIAASHSEVVLNEAADKGTVIAFLGKPRRLNVPHGRDLLRKALAEIRWEEYLQALQRGWVFFCEGATDLAILKAFAQRLDHPAREGLAAPFVHYVGGNDPQAARRHFHALKLANPHLVGFALFDRISNPLKEEGALMERMWRCREIENYFCREDVLLEWARGPRDEPVDLFSGIARKERWEAMRACIGELTRALEVTGKGSPWSPDLKASDEVLVPLMRNYLRRLNRPIQEMEKDRFHHLIDYMDPATVDQEVVEVLDAIADVANRAKGYD